MQCPFLKEARVRWCRAAGIRKPIPESHSDDAACRCLDERFHTCRWVSPEFRNAAAPCPHLEHALVQYCEAAPLTRFVPFSEPLLTRCGTDAHKYCDFYLDILRAARPPLEGTEFAAPEDLYYTRNHWWIDLQEQGLCHLGVDAFLARLLGVLRGRPFAFREGFLIWPSTFFLFVLSAMAAGPSFVALTTWLAEKVTRRRLVKDEVYQTMGRISGKLLLAYVFFKCIDTLLWINQTAPGRGFPAHRFYEYGGAFGTWILFAEIALLGLVPALLLVKPEWRARRGLLIAGAAMACLGVTLNRFVFTIQTLALPTMPFDRLLLYWPSWQEFAAFGFVAAYGMLVYSFSYRYLTLFPQERELAMTEARR